MPFALASKYLFSSYLLLSKIPLVQLCHIPFSPPENLLQLHPITAGVHPYAFIASCLSTALHNTCPMWPCPVPAALLPAFSQDNSSSTTHQPFCPPHPLLWATAFTLASDLHMAEPILACVWEGIFTVLWRHFNTNLHGSFGLCKVRYASHPLEKTWKK